ncbi:hypothetical protein B0J18DRAFT_30179 [Chaetomium sp. MPI-SDFR-AT-0129]|nr:hypothetical protein B0J18DRAFT_30179 [Chaetomium sp. MPI-SDFR-AT-0129]
MQFRSIATTALGLLPLANAVNINLFYSIFEDNCDHGQSYASCSDIVADKCCVYGSPIYSVEGTSLITEGVPAVVAAFTGPTGQCSVSCNSGGGDPTQCVNCNDEPLSGGMWYKFGKRDLSGPLKPAYEEVAYADRIGLWDDALGAHREFNISAGVPSVVVAELDAAFKKGSKAAAVSERVLAFEIKN